MPVLVPADRERVSTPPAFPGPLPGNPPVPVTRLRQVVDGMHEGVVVRDATGTIVDLNPAAERILRRPRAELIGSKTVNPRTAVNPDGTPLPHHESAASVALATGQDVVEQLNGVTMDDGELRWISVNARALREGDVITGVVTTFVDVTDQRNMEETLRASEAAAVAARDALTAVLDATTQYAIIGTDADGLITVFNGGAERMLGYAATDLIGRHHPELFHDPAELAARAAEWDIPVESVLGYGTRTRDTDTRDWTLVRSDGVKLPVSLAITAIRAADGTLTGYLGIGRDITAERQAARELRDAEERFRNAFDQAPIGKALVSPDGRFTRVNSALCAILGYGEADLLETTFQTLTHPDDLDVDLDNMRRMLAGKSESYAMEKRYQHADGHYIWALLSVSLVRDEAGAPLYFVSQIQDISEQKQINERLTDLTLHDPLTGLANRVLFSDRLAHAVERSRRSRERVAVLFIDLDRFKGVNDSLGHAAGDELLRQASERMRRAVRPADTIARLGGDEFTVLCEDLGAVNDAGWVADRLSDTLERPFDLFGNEIRIGVSIGIAVADRHDSAETVLAKADAAMYRTKNDRREWQGAA
jgi:diguanylate cyclase (GGDEF)-like protein/PAS domain S-box-containing protein